MTGTYDAIVIGAGLGGLSVSTFLARKGYRTLMLEKHNIPGGYATSFVRGRFEFEVALHELSDIGTEETPGALRSYLKYLGVLDKVEFLEIPHLYRSVFPGLDLTLPKGKRAYVETLCEAFPTDADGIRRFMDRIYRLTSEVGTLDALQYARFPENLKKLATLPLKIRALPRYFFATWGEVLNRDVKSPEARAVISQYWGYFGLPPARVSFFYFALALGSYISLGASYPKGRSQALSNAFVERFEELGGEARFHCGVERILTEADRVVGVRTETGEEFRADVVVSNADPISTCMDLIGLEHVPRSYMEGLRVNDIAPSSFNVYIGSARPMEELGVQDHEIFINSGFDYERDYDQFHVAGNPGELAATFYNTVWPEISPPGTTLGVLTALVYGKPWMEVPPDEYVDRKNAVADFMIERAEMVAPGLRDSLEVVEVATPLTNMRYANTLNGSVYGFNNTPYNHTILRLNPQGPKKGLFFVGVWGKPGGGYSPAMLNGQIAGRIIAMKSKPRTH